MATMDFTKLVIFQKVEGQFVYKLGNLSSNSHEVKDKPKKKLAKRKKNTPKGENNG